MDKLTNYLNSISRQEQDALADECDTSVNYLRKAVSVGQKIAAATCVNLERNSAGHVACESLRPDLKWVRIPDKDWPHPDGRPLLDHTVRAEKEAA